MARVTKSRYVKCSDGTKVRVYRYANGIPGTYYAAIGDKQLGRIFRLTPGVCEVAPWRGTYANNTPSIAESARALARMNAAGWL